MLFKNKKHQKRRNSVLSYCITCYDKMKKLSNKSKHIRCRMSKITTFEQFPTEIFFDIFEYLTGSHIFKSFFNLNRHFKELIYNAPNIHLNLSRANTKLFRNFLQVFHMQNIVSIVLSYEKINLLETLFNSTDGIQFKSLSLSFIPLHAFENRIPEILNIYKDYLINLKIDFADMHYNGSGMQAAQSFGYILTELPLLKHLILEYQYGIDPITYMPSSIINNTIVNLTIWLHGERRLIPLLYRFEKLKTLTIHYKTYHVRRTMLEDHILSYRNQLHEKISIDYPIKVRHIKVYDDEMILEKLERLFQIIISPTLLTLSLFTSKRPFQIHIMRWRQNQNLHSLQWHELLKRSLLSTMKRFHIEYEDVDVTSFMGNVVQVKKDFIKYGQFSSSWKVFCSYEYSKKILSIDVFPT